MSFREALEDAIAEESVISGSYRAALELGKAHYDQALKLLNQFAVASDGKEVAAEVALQAAQVHATLAQAAAIQALALK